MNRAQARAFGVGTTAALGRKKDNQKLTYSIECSSSIHESQITATLKHALFVQAGLNPATARLDLVYGMTDIHTILAETKAALEVEQRKNAQMAEELAQLKAATQQPAIAATREWITMTELAAREHCHPSTIWRAKESGRLVTKPNGGGPKRSQYVCDPTTYVRARG